MTAPLPPHEVLGVATVQHLAGLPPADALYAQVVRDTRPLPQAVIDVLEPVAQRVADPGRGAPPEALALVRASLALGFRFGTALLPDGDGDLATAATQVGRVRLFDLPVPLRQRFLPFGVADRAAHDSAWYGWYVGFALAVARSTGGDHDVVRLRWTQDPQELRRALVVHNKAVGRQRTAIVFAANSVVLSTAVTRLSVALGILVLLALSAVAIGVQRRWILSAATFVGAAQVEGQVSEHGYARFALPEATRYDWSDVRYAAPSRDGLVLGVLSKDKVLGPVLLPRRATTPGGWARLQELVREHVRP